MLWFTTSHKPSEHVEAKAKQLALYYRGHYAPRDHLSIANWLDKQKAEGAFVLTNTGIRYYQKGTEPLFFHPNMAYLRLQRVLRGEHDPLVSAVQAVAGDHIVDCTAGFASDAIMLAHAVGTSGMVTALESEKEVYILVKEGLREYVSNWAELQAAMSRIQLEQADYGKWLQAAADNSCDIIYFDPMFEKPVESSISFMPLRALANHNPLTEDAVKEACRVARKRVVLKDRKGSDTFERYGFTITGATSNQVAYGVIQL